MPLIDVELQSPATLRGGWAAFAAVCASRGWTDSAFAEGSQWYYHDGGGNWVCLRFVDHDRAVLIGHDHEYSETYFREAATYFGERKTNLLEDTPQWWGENIAPSPFGEWVGFIYGWEGNRWQRAPYDKNDGFTNIGLPEACSIDDTTELADHAADAPGLDGRIPDPHALSLLVRADADITEELLAAVVPGWDIAAGVAAGRKFLESPIGTA